MARPENLPAWVGWSDAYEKPYIPPNYASDFAQQFGYDASDLAGLGGRFANPSLPIGNDVYLSRTSAVLGAGGYRAPRNDIPPGSLVFGVKDDSSHGGLRGALSNFWRNSGETILKIISFYGTLIGVGGIFGVGPAASSAAASTTATSTTTAETSTMQLENWTDFGSASDAAVASNAVVSEPSFWDRLTGIGERALEYGVKQAISKEIFGDNQQPISTQATASQTPLNNALPQRGFASSVPYYKPASDMQPFIWLAGGFALVLVLILGLSRR